MPKTRKRKRSEDYEEVTVKPQRRRYRIISSSESDTADSSNDEIAIQPAVPDLDSSNSLAQPTTSASDKRDTAPGDEPTESPELDQEILEILGDAPKLQTNFGKATHKDLASRWQEILGKGLTKEIKDKLAQQYLIPENCDLLVAPLLNPEVQVALADTMVKRDMSLMTKQKQIGVAIAAINQAIELIIAKENHTKILKPISDACRLLCDSHYEATKTRRGFVISAINAEMKETLSDTKRDKFLFGDNISNKLKTAKAIQKSGKDLKQVRNVKSNVFNKNNFLKNPRPANKSNLNWKTLPRKTRPEAGKSRLPQQRTTASTSSQQREAPHHPATSYRKR